MQFTMSSDELNFLDPAFRLLHLHPATPLNSPDVASPSRPSSDSDTTEAAPTEDAIENKPRYKRPRESRSGAFYTVEEDSVLLAYIEGEKEKNRKAKREPTYRIASVDTWKKFEELVCSVNAS